MLACAVSQNTNDVELYEPMITKLTGTLTAASIIDPVKQALAGAGYWSEANAACLRPTLPHHRTRLRRRKTNRGWTHVRRRGLPAANSEWAFMDLTGNLQKLYKHQRAQLRATAA
ncbi:MAG: hypothetical protein ACLP0J_26005 [Solirubrobacteraceae bacterium]